MGINEDTPVGSIEHGYDQEDEEPDDNNYNEVENEHGMENGNAHGHNSDSNDHGEGGLNATTVGGNTNAVSIGNEDGGSSNAPQEQSTKEAPNQDVEIQENPPPFDTNVNSQVPNVDIPAMDNVVEEDDVLLIQMFPTVVEEKVPSIGRTLVGLGRPSPPTSNRPPVYSG
jgi:hypothetical protein